MRMRVCGDGEDGVDVESRLMSRVMWRRIELNAVPAKHGAFTFSWSVGREPWVCTDEAIVCHRCKKDGDLLMPVLWASSHKPLPEHCYHVKCVPPRIWRSMQQVAGSLPAWEQSGCSSPDSGTNNRAVPTLEDVR
jgi:hypothetical protein